MSLTEYADAAMAACPRCRAATGDPCRERACRNGYRNCDYKICSYLRDLPEPHLQRVVAARQATTADPERAALAEGSDA